MNDYASPGGPRMDALAPLTQADVQELADVWYKKRPSTAAIGTPG